MRGRYWHAGSAMLLGLVLAAPAALGATAEPTPYRYAYDDGTLHAWQGVQEPAPGRISVVASPTNPARLVMRVELQPGDVLAGGSARAEVQARHGTHADGRDGWADPDLSQRWYHGSIMLAPTFPFVHDWTILAQWPSDAGGRPSLALGIIDGRLDLLAPTGFLWTALQPASTGTWHSFTLGANWSAVLGAGWVTLWIDGVQVLKKRSMADEKCCYRRGLLSEPWPNYFKMGLYRDPQIAAGAVVFDGPMKVAADRASAEQ